jgi:NAD(P)-dependent dehydrogenase (short-subunit alcohol dehydrogenase family)
MNWTVENIPDLTGKVAVVTGANGGLGLETARALASHGAHVVMAARNLDEASGPAEEIRAGCATASLQIEELDLASLDSIHRFAQGLGNSSIGMLINNAGVMGIPEQSTADGFEMQFGVNHLGHFALTALLLPALLRTPGARVVAVTSTARHFGKPVDPDNPHLRGVYEPWRAYGQSKLANLHFAVGLHRRLRAAGSSASSLVAHPGLSNTDLQSNSVRETGGGSSQRLFESLAHRTGMTAERGALSQLRAATDRTIPSGNLVAPRFGNFGSPVLGPLMRSSTDETAIDTLWTVSERETGIALDVESAVATLET